MILSPTLRERFQANVDWTPTARGCFLWIGRSVTNGGYGQISIATGVSRGAHQVAWFLEHGEWPWPNALHDCDVKLCVNVAHLHEGTHKQNAKEAVERGLKVHKYGIEHHNGKVRDEDLPVIRARRAAGEKLKPIAADYSCTVQLISQICCGRARTRR